MPGGPPGRPYYRPLRERGNRTGELLRSFWMQDNIAGSWAPASLKRMAPAAWLVDDNNQYVLPTNHLALAKQHLLFGSTVSAMAMGCFFLRNEGFLIAGQERPGDVIAGFRLKFAWEEADESEFALLFDMTLPREPFEWLERVPPEELARRAPRPDFSQGGSDGAR